MPAGLIVIEKPAGWTSMDVCAKLRGVFHERRVGHSGTLDPMATGLLLVFVGRATRAVEFTDGYDKCYEADLRLGQVSDTQDSSGTILERHAAAVTREELEAVLPRFRGEQFQLPPMYSAIKVNGKKLYELARRGREVPRAPRAITIHSLDLLGQRENGDWRLSVSCSKGTYIRTLCHDIGQALGCGGLMSALRRTRVGPFTEGLPLEEVLRAEQPECLLRSVEGCFQALPRLDLDARDSRAARSGAVFPVEAPEGRFRVYAADGAFLLLGQVENGRLRTIKSFFPVEQERGGSA